MVAALSILTTFAFSCIVLTPGLVVAYMVVSWRLDLPIAKVGTGFLSHLTCGAAPALLKSATCELINLVHARRVSWQTRAGKTLATVLLAVIAGGYAIFIIELLRQVFGA